MVAAMTVALPSALAQHQRAIPDPNALQAPAEIASAPAADEFYGFTPFFIILGIVLTGFAIYQRREIRKLCEHFELRAGNLRQDAAYQETLKTEAQAALAQVKERLANETTLRSAREMELERITREKKELTSRLDDIQSLDPEIEKKAKARTEAIALEKARQRKRQAELVEQSRAEEEGFERVSDLLTK
jgi:hypothetical protein